MEAEESAERMWKGDERGTRRHMKEGRSDEREKCSEAMPGRLTD